MLYSRFSLVTLCVFVLVTQSCLSLCDPMGCSPPGSSVHGILQARKLEWVAIRFFRDVRDPEMEPRSSALQADSLLPEPPGKPIANNYRSSSSNLPRSFPYLFIADDALRLCSVFTWWMGGGITHFARSENAQILIFRFSSVQLLCHVRLFVTP